MSTEPLSGGVPAAHVGDETGRVSAGRPDPVVSPVQGEAEPSDYCPRDHGCSLPAGHDGDCYLTAALCECTECEAKAQWEGDDAPPDGLAVELLRLRERHVDGVVKSRINQRGGDVDGEQIVGWDAEVVAAWDREYPACAARIAEALERAS